MQPIMNKFMVWLEQHLPSIFYYILILIIILSILGKNTTMVMIPIAIILGIIQASMITSCDSDDDYYVRFIAFLVPLSFEAILFGEMHDFININAVLIVSFLFGFALVFIIHLVRKHYMNVNNVHNADDNDDSYFTI